MQLPFVQNKIAKTITKTLSEELGTTVSLDHVSLEFFDKLVLENFYVEDLAGDTLLFTQELKANIDTDLRTLLRRQLTVEEISLNHAQFSLRRDSGEVKNNLGFIIQKFSNPDTTILAEKSDSAPFLLDINALYINDFEFRKSDAYMGEDLSINSGSVKIIIEELNLPNSLLAIKSVEITRPAVNIVQYNWVEEEVPPNPDTDSPFVATVENFDLYAGTLNIDNLRRSPVKVTDDKTLDLNHLRVFDANISINNFRYHDWVFTGELEKATARDKSGFLLEELSANDVKITERRAEFNGMRLITPDSNVGDTIVFKYRQFPDWREFPEKVLLDAKFSNKARVKVGDIMAFAPALKLNPFFLKNQEEVVTIKGRISGKINNLRGRDLTISLAGNTFLKGDFNTRNLAIKDEQYLDLRLKRLVTDMETVKQIIPNFRAPANFDKLGNIDFKGEFSGFFVDFVAYGDLKTDLGRAELDMRMNLKEGREKARYSGEISLTDFDLASWTSNPNFGNVTFVSQVKNGIGLTGETAQADLTAAIQNFTFKGYTYDNLNVAGQLKERFFNGDFKIADEYVAFDFEGKVDFTRPKPLFDFSANVEKLALKPLNLAKKDLVLSGKINRLYLEDIKLSDIKGTAAISDFTILQNGRDTFAIDTVSIISEIAPDSTKRFFVNSDILRTELNGAFDLSKIPQTFIHFFADNFPDFATRLNVNPDTSLFIPQQQYNFSIDIFDSKNFNRLVHPGLGNLANVRANGYLDNVRDSLEWDINVPILQFNKITAVDINTYGETTGSEGDLNFEVFETKLSPKISIPPLKLLSIVDTDSLDFAINLLSNSDFLDNINLDGQIYPHEDMLELTLNNSALIFLSDIWTIEEGNYIRAGQGRVEAQNFKLTSEGREISLYTVGEKSLELNADNFDLSFINEIWRDKRFQLAGPFTLNARSENIFKLQGLHTFIEADTFIVNGDDWGVLRVDASAANIKSRYDAYINLYQASTGQQLLAEGYFNPPNLKVAPGDVGLNKQVPNYLDIDVNISTFPVSFLEYLIQNGISNTVGTLDADFKMSGKLNRLIMDGKASVYDLGVTIDYLNTRYFAHDQTVVLRENMIDATGGFITDELGNKAFVFGGLVHNYMKNWGPEVRVTGDNFLVLNTTEEDNSLYYGRGVGQGDVSFSGTFRSTNINVIAKTGIGTEISIPVTYDQEADAVSFIRFKDKKKVVNIKDKDKNLPPSNLIEGLDINIDLELTPAANMKMIFDEKAGDVIQGSGTGNIRMSVPRGLNDFIMYGDYEIESGEYLFTLKNIVNKPFLVRRGGTITWSGDPFGADINLVAEYKDLNVAPYNFIQEYLVSTTSDVQNLARQATQVDLKMLLQGQLLKPDISFDIEFPNLRNDMKTYVDSKMRLVSRDQNELNRQVFGLIVAGQFLPNSTTLQNEGLAIGINTLTEMLSQQLSLYLTELVSGWLAEDGFITGIDFDIAYNRYQNAEVDNVAKANNELQVRLKNYLFNDRVGVNAGVNIDLDNDANRSNNPENSGAFYAGDFAIEYYLTPDKQFKIRFYQSIQPELGGRRSQTGLGLSYRKEFNSFSEFIKGMKRTTKRLKTEEQTSN